MTPAHWYRGDYHVHSRFSDGELEPGRLLESAHQHGLDFVAATEHNLVTPDSWLQYPSDVLVISGQETTTRSGHWLALGLDPGQFVGWDDRIGGTPIDAQLDAVRSGGGLCVAAHPIAPFPGGTCEYRWDSFDLVEVWNGRWDSELAWQADNEAVVARWCRDLAERPERWRPAIGNSDAHLHGQIAHPHTVVRAESRTTRALLAGLRAGRSWIAASADIALSLTVESDGRVAGIGETLVSAGRSASLTISGVPAGRLAAHTDAGPMQARDLPDRPAKVTIDVTGVEYAWVEVRYADRKMAAITNPVFLTERPQAGSHAPAGESTHEPADPLTANTG